jgi:hypothetical protein
MISQLLRQELQIVAYRKRFPKKIILWHLTSYRTRTMILATERPFPRPE